MATPLPSASKPRRSRQSLTPSVQLVDKAQFTTPSAKHWEEGESLESITEGIHELGLVGVAEEEEGGDGDVEHMPPRSERESNRARSPGSRHSMSGTASDNDGKAGHGLIGSTPTYPYRSC